LLAEFSLDCAKEPFLKTLRDFRGALLNGYTLRGIHYTDRGAKGQHVFIAVGHAVVKR
jgi:hypothetical protein